MKNNMQGLTLVEVIIATVIFSLILAATMGLLFTTQDAFDEASISASLKGDGTRIMDKLTEYLEECKIYSAPVSATKHATMTIQVPVLVGGKYWDDDGDPIYWGADGQLGWTMTYQFVSKETLDETVTRIDYNHDNDLLDKFERGIIDLVFKDGGGATQRTITLGHNVVVTYSAWEPSLFLRVGETGLEDIVNGNRIKVELLLGKVTPDQKSVVVNIKKDVTLRNPID